MESLIFMVSLIMSFLRMVDYPLFFPSRSTLTLDTIATLSGTLGFYLNRGAGVITGVSGGVTRPLSGVASGARVSGVRLR